MANEMKRFILALNAMGEDRKKIERAFARAYGETYPSNEELQSEFEAAFAALPKEDRVTVAMGYAAASLQIAIERIAPIMQKVIDDFIDAINQLASYFSAFVNSIDWQALAEYVRSISVVDKYRPQRKPDPVSRTQARLAIKRLPNTLAVWR